MCCSVSGRHVPPASLQILVWFSMPDAAHPRGELISQNLITAPQKVRKLLHEGKYQLWSCIPWNEYILIVKMWDLLWMLELWKLLRNSKTWEKKNLRRSKVVHQVKANTLMHVNAFKTFCWSATGVRHAAVSNQVRMTVGLKAVEERVKAWSWAHWAGMAQWTRWCHPQWQQQMVSGPLALPTGLLGRETEQPCTKYKATDWAVPLKKPRADEMLRGAALTCLRRRIIMLTPVGSLDPPLSRHGRQCSLSGQ